MSDNVSASRDQWLADSREGVSALSAGIQAINRIDEQSLIAAKCRALLAGYDARWRNAGYVPLSIEGVLTSDLFNPDTNKKSRTFALAGKLDVIAEHSGKTYLIDHKTTSQSIDDPNSPYWRQLAIEGQVNHYHLLAWLNGSKFDGAVWDVIRKPTISPKKLTKAERTSATANRNYFGRRVSESSLQSLQVDERETHEMYEARLASDCINERPGWYFQRRNVPRLDAEILEYAREVWQHGQDMLATRNQTTEHNLPVRNSGACLLYNSPCKFLGICSGFDTPDSDRWQRKAWVHSELSPMEGDGRELLTNSRIRTYQTCRRKAYYEYELGIERQDEEDKESLYFGSLFHAGLNAWWSTFLESDNDNGTSSSVSEIGQQHGQASFA